VSSERRAAEAVSYDENDDMARIMSRTTFSRLKQEAQATDERV